jgi:hypothetical protein
MEIENGIQVTNVLREINYGLENCVKDILVKLYNREQEKTRFPCHFLRNILASPKSVDEIYKRKLK